MVLNSSLKIHHEQHDVRVKSSESDALHFPNWVTLGRPHGLPKSRFLHQQNGDSDADPTVVGTKSNQYIYTKYLAQCQPCRKCLASGNYCHDFQKLVHCPLPNANYVSKTLRNLSSPWETICKMACLAQQRCKLTENLKHKDIMIFTWKVRKTHSFSTGMHLRITCAPPHKDLVFTGLEDLSFVMFSKVFPGDSNGGEGWHPPREWKGRGYCGEGVLVGGGAAENDLVAGA